jgi:hypothetical protein
VADGAYTIPQLYDLAIQAGWDPAVAPYAAATAWVESSGRPWVASGTGPVGLWQINRANAQALGYDLNDRLDPLKSAKMALELWERAGGKDVPPEQGFHDWWPYDRNTSQKEADFQKALAEAKKGGADGTASRSPLDNLANGLDNLNPLSAIGKLTNQFIGFAKIMAWFVNPANDIRVLLGIFGLAFLGGGVWMLGREVRRG